MRKFIFVLFLTSFCFLFPLALTASAEPAGGPFAGRSYEYTFLITNSPAGTACKGFDSVSMAPKGPLYLSTDSYDYPYRETEGTEALWGYEAENWGHEDYRVVLLEQGAPLQEAVVDQFDWGTYNDISLPSPHSFQIQKMGQMTDTAGYEYLVWGCWEDTAPFDQGLLADDGTNLYYAASGVIWHAEGFRTSPNSLADLQAEDAQGLYSGGAEGTYADSTIPDVDMLSGSFSFKADFGSLTVSDFTLSLSGAGHSAEISSNGTGVISPADSSFVIDDPSVTIDGDAIPYADSISGIFLGSTAQGAGLLWSVSDGDSRWASGIFHGQGDFDSRAVPGVLPLSFLSICFILIFIAIYYLVKAKYRGIYK